MTLTYTDDDAKKPHQMAYDAARKVYIGTASTGDRIVIGSAVFEHVRRRAIELDDAHLWGELWSADAWQRYCAEKADTPGPHGWITLPGEPQ